MAELPYLQCVTNPLESRKALCWSVRGTRFSRGGSSPADESGPLSARVSHPSSSITRPDTLTKSISDEWQHHHGGNMLCAQIGCLQSRMSSDTASVTKMHFKLATFVLQARNASQEKIEKTSAGLMIGCTAILSSKPVYHTRKLTVPDDFNL